MLTENQTLKNGRYYIVAKLQQEGISAFYEAFDTTFEKAVVLKEYPADAAIVLADARVGLGHPDFSTQAQILADIEHHSIVQVFDHFVESGKGYLVIEQVKGLSLADFLEKKQGAFGVSDLKVIADQLLDSLVYLHTNNPQITHGNVNPLNITIGEGGKLKLSTPGNGAAFEYIENVSSAFQSPVYNYAPVEAIKTGLEPSLRKMISESFQDREVSPESDIYSLGALIYRMATGNLPIDALERLMHVSDGKADPLVDVKEANPFIPVELAEIITKALAVDPQERYDSALIMRQAYRTAFVRIKEREVLEAKEQAEAEQRFEDEREQRRLEQIRLDEERVEREREEEAARIAAEQARLEQEREEAEAQLRAEEERVLREKEAEETRLREEEMRLQQEREAEERRRLEDAERKERLEALAAIESERAEREEAAAKALQAAQDARKQEASTKEIRRLEEQMLEEERLLKEKAALEAVAVAEEARRREDELRKLLQSPVSITPPVFAPAPQVTAQEEPELSPDEQLIAELQAEAEAKEKPESRFAAIIKAQAKKTPEAAEKLLTALETKADATEDPWYSVDVSINRSDAPEFASDSVEFVPEEDFKKIPSKSNRTVYIGALSAVLVGVIGYGSWTFMGSGETLAPEKQQADIINEMLSQPAQTPLPSQPVQVAEQQPAPQTESTPEPEKKKEEAAKPTPQKPAVKPTPRKKEVTQTAKAAEPAKLPVTVDDIISGN